MSISEQPSLPDTPPPIDLARLDVGDGGFAFAESEVKVNKENLKKGYIAIYRSLLKDRMHNDPEFMWLWIVMLLKAAHEAIDVNWSGKTITLKPGQFISGRKKLALDSGVNASKVLRILKRMKTDHQIDQQAGNLSSVFTIVNWKDYQIGGQPNGHQTISQRSASDQQPDTNKNEKNEKNVKNEEESLARKEARVLSDKSDFSKDFLEFWRTYPASRRVDKKGCWTKWKSKNLDSIADQIMISLENHLASEQWNSDYPKIVNSTTWLNQSRWEQELPPVVETKLSSHIQEFEGEFGISAEKCIEMEKKHKEKKQHEH